MYRYSRTGLWCCVPRKFCSVTDKKMLAIVGENAAPIAVPWVCWNVIQSSCS